MEKEVKNIDRYLDIKNATESFIKDIDISKGEYLLIMAYDNESKKHVIKFEGDAQALSADIILRTKKKKFKYAYRMIWDIVLNTSAVLVAKNKWIKKQFNWEIKEAKRYKN